jgi:hypothetical protein
MQIRHTLTLFLFLAFNLSAQQRIHFCGNISSICFDDDSIELTISTHFPDSLQHYDALFIFSMAESILTESNMKELLVFLEAGNGVYIGSENWPLQAESKQLTNLFYSKETWGNFTATEATTNSSGFIADEKKIDAGKSTVAFPLDYRLKVEAWVDDEPLILSGRWLNGCVLIDGGYSRFYCTNNEQLNTQMLKRFIHFLLND